MVFILFIFEEDDVELFMVFLVVVRFFSFRGTYICDVKFWALTWLNCCRLMLWLGWKFVVEVIWIFGGLAIWSDEGLLMKVGKFWILFSSIFIFEGLIFWRFVLFIRFFVALEIFGGGEGLWRLLFDKDCFVMEKVRWSR